MPDTWDKKYQGVRNINFYENFASVLNEWSLATFAH